MWVRERKRRPRRRRVQGRSKGERGDGEEDTMNVGFAKKRTHMQARDLKGDTMTIL